MAGRRKLSAMQILIGTVVGIILIKFFPLLFR